MDSVKRCEECGAKKPFPEASSFALFDYCAHCSRNLCDSCMERGCCDNVPAVSGEQEDSSHGG